MDKKTYKRTCPQCKQEFETDDRRQKYCTRAHGNTYRAKRFFKKASKAVKQMQEQAA